MSAMQVLVQEKTVHYQQNVLTSKGPQRQTHLTSAEAEHFSFLDDLSLKLFLELSCFDLKMRKIVMLKKIILKYIQNC